MQTDDRRPILFVISGGLLVVWLFLASLALADLMNFTVETSAQDEHALSELGFGLKSNVPSLGAPGDTFLVTAEVPEPAFSISFVTVHRLNELMRRDPSPLPLYQQLRVYRI